MDRPIPILSPQICAKLMVLPTKLQIIKLETFIFAENAYRNT